MPTSPLPQCVIVAAAAVVSVMIYAAVIRWAVREAAPPRAKPVSPPAAPAPPGDPG